MGKLGKSLNSAEKNAFKLVKFANIESDLLKTYEERTPQCRVRLTIHHTNVWTFATLRSYICAR